MSEKECLAHESRIGALENNVDKLMSSLDKNTEATNRLVTQLSVTMDRYDRIERDQTSIKKQADENTKSIAEMKPTVDALRKLAWQMIGGSLVGGGAVAAIATAIMAMYSK